MGWFPRGAMVPEFDEAAFTSEIGDLVTCKTQFGIHIVRVDAEKEVTTPVPLSVDQLRDILENPAKMEEVQLIDVREPGEVEMANLGPAFKNYPLSQAAEYVFVVWGVRG